MDEAHHNKEDAKPVTLVPRSHTPVMVTSTHSGLLMIKPKLLRASREFLQVAGRKNQDRSRPSFLCAINELVRKLSIHTKAYDHITNNR